MLKRLLLSSCIAAVAAFPALAEDATTPTPLPPAPADQTAPEVQDQAVPSTGAVGEVAPEAPVMPPPGDAIIPAQAADEVRAESLIGMSVFNTDGSKVGEVKDILFDERGQATGMVLSVGGVLGIGAKPVGLNWSEIDVRPEAEMVKIHYSKEQLEAAPAFRTQEAQQADSAPPPLPQQEPPSAAPEPTPPAATE
jgi:sporulation protein YlmC with PRC-barrel domain